MNTRSRTIILSIILGLAAWVIDAALDALIFFEGTFWDLLILNVPQHELYIRFVILVFFIIFGLIASHLLAERARTESALRESQRTLETLMGNLPGMAYRCLNDKKWTMKFVSEGVVSLTGYTPADLLNNRTLAYGDLIAPEDRPAVWNTVQAGVRSGEPYQVSYRIMTASGEEKWVWEQGEAVQSPESDGLMLEGFITDITEPKRAEEALHESEERSRTTLYSIGDAVITTDRQGRIRQMNPVAAALTGWDEAEAAGRLLPEVFYIINEQTRDEVENPVERVLSEGVIVGLANHTLLVARDGTEYPIADSGAPIHNAQGEITGVVLVFRDQAEERAAERTLRESEQKYRRLFENMLSGFAYHRVVLDEEGTPVDYVFLDANDAFQQQTGLDREEIIGKPVTEVIPGVEEEGWIQRYGQVVLTGEPTRFEQYSEALDRWFWVSAYRLREDEFVTIFADITERKQAEEALRESEARLTAFTSAMPDVGFILDKEGRYLEVLGAQEDLLAAGVATLKGRRIQDVLSQEAAEKSLRAIQRAIATGQVQSVEYSLNVPAGLRWFEARTLPMETDTNEAETVVFVARDITEQKQAEEALRASEHRYRALAENAPTGLWQIDPDGYTIYANPAMCTIAQVESSEDLIGTHISEFITGESLRRTRQELARRSSGIASRYEVKLIGRKGRVRSVLISGAPIMSSNGDLQSTIGLIIDITERKRAEEALRESEEKYRDLYTSIRDAILVADTNRRIIDCNPAFSELFGYTLDEIRGEETVELYANEKQFERMGAALRENMGDPNLLYTVDYEAKSGRVFPGETNVFYLQDDKGDIAGFIGLIRDITERKRAQEAEHQQRLLAEALRDTAAMLHSTLELDEVLKRILQAVEELLPHRGANIMLLAEDGEDVREAKYCPCYDEHGLTQPSIPPATILDRVPPFSELLRTRQPIIAADIREYPGWPDDIPSIQWIRGYLGAPIIVDGEVVGFINLDNDQADQYTPEDAEVLAALANQAAVAIDSARLYEQARQQRLLAEALRDTAEALHGTLEIDEVLGRILDATEELVPHSGANIMLADETSGALKLARYCPCYEVNGLPEPQLPAGTPLTTLATYREIAQTREPVIISDTSEQADWPTDNLTIRWVRSYMCAPILVDGEIAGFINVDSAEVDAFTPDDTEALVALAGQAAIAIDSARLYEHAREQARYLAALNQASSRVSRWGLDLNGVLQAVVTSLSEEIGVDFARIWLADKENETLEMRASAGQYAHTGRQLTDGEVADRSSQLERIAREGKPYLTNQVQEDEAFDREWAAERGVVAFAGYPLKKDRRLMAVLTIFHSQPLPDTVLDVMGSFVNQAAIAIENARLYEELEEYSTILEQAVAERTADLERAKERVESILHHSPDGIVLLTPGSTIETTNPAAQEMLGYAEDELAGQPTPALVDPAHVDRCHDALEQTRQEQTTQRVELLARRKDGTTFDAQAVLGPVVEDGRLIGIVCSLRDITRLKEIERIKDDFLATAAHELRTPLTSIRGFSELLLTRDLSIERQDRYHHHINAQSTQLAQIIDDLLDISRLESGRGLDLHLKPVRMDELIAEVVQPFIETAPGHTFRLGVGQAGPVSGDAFRLAQVIRNLVQNAVKYSPTGGKITIATHTQDDVLAVSVADEGIGLTTSELAHLFEKFYRANTTETSGTGLGLVISKLIVEGHGGEIWAESEPGVGSTFTFTLPLADKE